MGKAGTRTWNGKNWGGGGGIINYKQALLLLQKGYLQKYGNMKEVISSSNWDGEEGGDEEVEQEEEVGGKITIIIK